MLDGGDTMGGAVARHAARCVLVPVPGRQPVGTRLQGDCSLEVAGVAAGPGPRFPVGVVPEAFVAPCAVQPPVGTRAKDRRVDEDPATRLGLKTPLPMTDEAGLWRC